MLDNTAYYLRISPWLPWFWTSPDSVRIFSTPSQGRCRQKAASPSNRRRRIISQPGARSHPGREM